MREPPHRLLSLLETFDAGATAHRAGRSLAAHLVATWRVLEGWAAPPHVAAAGLIHSIYGTEAFDVASAGHDTGSRARVRRAAGDAAEALAYAFCALERRALLADPFAVPLRDRFSGGDLDLTRRQRAALAEILLANEIDLAFARKAGDLAKVAAKAAAVFVALKPALPRRVLAAVRPLGLR